ncbi:T9SS type B sorting domain-containing protein [Aestuariivivens sp. NBU2969]|uniref:T9SS type B sorting domain-containing protein n=1 Tax=Aestuariivivens sp. NBU2969 TaxID=2873267 RepID=UPI001CBFB277|nr:T9SS type B sorting domain-containing protein [Aestuariivivens sp. NBU2969]
MKKNHLISIVVIFFLGSLYAQKQAINWYFGQGAGLNFNTEPPTVLTDSRLYTYEGCATISDKNGDLLFYTDGITVYNKQHQIMPNGVRLLGDPSSSQSAIIVPKPEDENIYYIFTVGFEKPGLRYSTVDIRLDNGNGDILVNEKNINLLSSSSEKITAVKHSDGTSIWVISFDGVTFHSFKVSSQGINRISVKSRLGELILDPRGYLKASPNGEYLAMANHANKSYLLSFFAANGKVFPGIQFEFENEQEEAYGVEFSAENNKLYVDTFLQQSTNTPDVFKYTRFLYQFDLNSGNVNNSRKLISKNEDTYRGALQLALNGKIYRALSSEYDVGSRYLGVINNPELDGDLCNYQHDAIDLSPSFRLNYSTQGLPPFIQSLFFFTINVKKPCENQTAEFSINTIEENYTVFWDFGDSLTSTEINPTHKYPNSGFYDVSATMQLQNGDSKTISRRIQIFEVPDLIPDQVLEQCDNDNDGIANFNLNEAIPLITDDNIEFYSFKFYRNVSDLNNDIEIDTSVPFQNSNSNPQELWLKVINEVGCEEITNFYIRAINATLGTIPDFVVCDDNDGNIDDNIGLFNLEDEVNAIKSLFNLDPSISIYYFLNESDAEFEINEIETIEYLSTSKKIWVRAESENQECIGIEPLNLIVNQVTKPSINDNYYVCLNKPDIPTIIDAGSNYDYYEWKMIENDSIIETNSVVSIFKTGNYSLTVYSESNGLVCSRGQNFVITASNVATITAIEVTDMSQNNVITVNVTGEGTYEYALYDENSEFIYRNFQTSNSFENVGPGIYTLHVKDTKNDCGTINNLVSVIGFPRFFTPNNDGNNDTWRVHGISNMFQPNSKIIIFNRFGKLIKQLNPLDEGWDGTLNGKELPTDDYWFVVTLQDGRVFKSHFTLKR